MLNQTWCHIVRRSRSGTLFLRHASFPYIYTGHRRQGSSDFGKSSKSVPSWLSPYFQLARYDRPIGSWLLYLPCTWSIALAAPTGCFPDLYMLTLFGLGSVFMRGAGCTINDLLDRKFDQQVERTRQRPLASGAISVRNALLFLSLQLSASLLILLQLNWYSVCLGLLSMLPVSVYPLCKRVTYWPQIVLGLTLNWGTWLGYSAVVGYCSIPCCLPMYIGGTLWTTIYDTIYSHQDIEDDLNIGVKSLAIRLQGNAKPYLGLFQLGMLSCFLAVGMNSGAGWFYYGGTLLTMAHLARLVYKVDLGSPDSCLKTFRASRNTGLLYFGTIVLDKLFANGAAIVL